MAGAIVGRLGRHPTSLLLLTLPRHAAAHHRLHSPSSSQGTVPHLPLFLRPWRFPSFCPAAAVLHGRPLIYNPLAAVARAGLPGACFVSGCVGARMLIFFFFLLWWIVLGRWNRIGLGSLTRKYITNKYTYTELRLTLHILVDRVYIAVSRFRLVCVVLVTNAEHSE
jgi:hypothetical protein